MNLPASLKLALHRQAGLLTPDPDAISRFLQHAHHRRYPARTNIFRPGDASTSFYYIVEGSVSILIEEDDGRELTLGYFGPGEFVGEMGLFSDLPKREVILRTRCATEVAEIGCHAFLDLLKGPLAQDASTLLYCIGHQLARRLRDTTRKASRLAFLDVSDRIRRTLHDLTLEADAMSHPDGVQLRISRQELARLVGCSREMAGRVLKKLQADGLLFARGKTIVVYAEQRKPEPSP